jgi:hypothetical protein
LCGEEGSSSTGLSRVSYESLRRCFGEAGSLSSGLWRVRYQSSWFDENNLSITIHIIIAINIRDTSLSSYNSGSGVLDTMTGIEGSHDGHLEAKLAANKEKMKNRKDYKVENLDRVTAQKDELETENREIEAKINAVER